VIRRWVFDCAAVVSLLLFVAMAGLWLSTFKWEMFCVHSAFSPYGNRWYWINWVATAQDGYVRWESDGAVVNTANYESFYDVKPGKWVWKIQRRGTGDLPMGFPQNLIPRWQTVTSVPTRPEVIQFRQVYILLPFWLLLSPTMPLPILFAFRRRRVARRRKLCRCLACGYELTGNASGVCPECGTQVKPA
jgi:hypothetical protein